MFNTELWKPDAAIFVLSTFCQKSKRSKYWRENPKKRRKVEKAK